MNRLIIALILCLLGFGEASAQSKADVRRAEREAKKVQTALAVDSMIRAGSFTFRAERAVSNLPAKPYITLDGRDFVRITPKQIDSYLPFYGVLYSAPIGANQSPLTFESDQFTYQVVSDTRPGRHLVRIEVERSSSPLPTGRFTLIVEAFDDLSAVATVTFASGSTSMFYGAIEPNTENQ